MRTTIATLAAVLAAAGLAQGVMPPDPACSGTCTVEAASTGYMPPLLALHSGSEVVWHSTDVTHVQRETSQPLGSPGACFSVTASGGGDSPAVRLDFDGVTVEATVGTTTTTCENAVVTEAGALVPYHCTLHASMRGTILVVP